MMNSRLGLVVFVLVTALVAPVAMGQTEVQGELVITELTERLGDAIAEFGVAYEQFQQGSRPEVRREKAAYEAWLPHQQRRGTPAYEQTVSVWAEAATDRTYVESQRCSQLYVHLSAWHQPQDELLDAVQSQLIAMERSRSDAPDEYQSIINSIAVIASGASMIDRIIPSGDASAQAALNGVMRNLRMLQANARGGISGDQRRAVYAEMYRRLQEYRQIAGQLVAEVRQHQNRLAHRGEFLKAFVGQKTAEINLTALIEQVKALDIGDLGKLRGGLFESDFDTRIAEIVGAEAGGSLELGGTSTQTGRQRRWSEFQGGTQ